MSRYGQGKHIGERDPKETANDFEKRAWRRRLHVDKDGYVVIPGITFKNCLTEAAAYLSKKIPGKRNSTYTKHVTSGIFVTESLVLPVKAADVPGEEVFVPADGKRGGGSRVLKTFPYVEEWSGDVTFYVADELVTEEVFLEHLQQAGMFIGIGVWRPSKNGLWGRFKVEKVKWSDAK